MNISSDMSHPVFVAANLKLSVSFLGFDWFFAGISGNIVTINLDRHFFSFFYRPRIRVCGERRAPLIKTIKMLKAIAPLCQLLRIAQTFLPKTRFQITNFLKFTAAKSRFSVQKQVTTTRRFVYRTRSQNLPACPRESIRLYTKDHWPFSR
jgi:hypothetical protein